MERTSEARCLPSLSGSCCFNLPDERIITLNSSGLQPERRESVNSSREFTYIRSCAYTFPSIGIHENGDQKVWTPPRFQPDSGGGPKSGLK